MHKILTKLKQNISEEFKNFYKKKDSKKFKNLERLNFMKENKTENFIFSFFNLTSLKITGHYISQLSDKSKIEIVINEKNPNKGTGIITYPNGNIYIGEIFLENSKNGIETKTPFLKKIRSIASVAEFNNQEDNKSEISKNLKEIEKKFIYSSKMEEQFEDFLEYRLDELNKNESI